MNDNIRIREEFGLMNVRVYMVSSASLICIHLEPFYNLC